MVKLTCPRSTSRDLLALDENWTPVAEFASRIEYHYTTDPIYHSYETLKARIKIKKKQ